MRVQEHMNILKNHELTMTSTIITKLMVCARYQPLPYITPPSEENLSQI